MGEGALTAVEIKEAVEVFNSRFEVGIQVFALDVGHEAAFGSRHFGTRQFAGFGLSLGHLQGRTTMSTLHGWIEENACCFRLLSLLTKVGCTWTPPSHIGGGTFPLRHCPSETSSLRTGEVVVNVRWRTTWPDFVGRWRGIRALPIISCPGFLRFSARQGWCLKRLRNAWHSISGNHGDTASRYRTKHHVGLWACGLALATGAIDNSTRLCSNLGYLSPSELSISH